MSTNNRALKTVPYVAACCLYMGGPVKAEESLSGKNISSVLEEVVVTARRREESLQEVPVAVAAFGAKQIEELGLETEADLQMFTPGLMVRATNSSNQLSYSLRGQSIDAFSYSAPAVLAYVNEVQAGGVTASSFFDLASIQVLKGPQGTLFGRNATGGAVLYQTQAPSDEQEGYFKLGYGNFDNREYQGAVNVPIANGLSARFAGLLREREGYQYNRYHNVKQASIDTENFRASFRFQNEKVDNVFAYYTADHGGYAEGLRIRNSYSPGQTNNGVPLNATAETIYYPGILADGLLDQDNPRVVEMGFDGMKDFIQKARKADFYDVFNDVLAENDTTQDLVSNSTSIELQNGFVLKNIIGYNEVVGNQPADVDGSPFMVLRNGDESDAEGYTYETKQWSNELQLSGVLMEDRLDFIVGLYVSNEKFRNRIPLKVAADYPTAFEPAPGLFAYDFETDDDSMAIFGQVTYAINDRTDITAGYRHTWEEIGIRQLSGDFNRNALGVKPRSEKFDRPSWTLTLDYEVSDELMVYASTRGSWRTGGFNGTSTNTDSGGALVADDFDPETTWDMELGAKFAGSIGKFPARINAALYDQYIEDVQRTVYLGIASLSGNVKEAQVTGLELDVQVSLTDWLEVGLSYAWTDARYTDPKGNVAGYDLDFGPYGDAPEHSGTVFAKFTKDLGKPGELSARVDYYSVSQTYFTNLNDTIGPGTQLEDYQLMNARVALDNVGGSTTEIALFVRNALDEEYERGGLPLAGVVGVNSTIVGEPRTYGIEITFRF